MEYIVYIEDRKIAESPDGVRQVQCEVVVVDASGEVVHTRSFTHDLHPPGVTQEAVQARLDEAKTRALSEARAEYDIDLESLQ